MEERQKYERLPAVEKKIGAIDKQNDSRVSILGTIIDRKENIIAVDDGSGKAEVFFEEMPDTSKMKLVRVIGRIVPMENGFEIRGEILQDMSGLDMKLFEKVKKLEAKFG